MLSSDFHELVQLQAKRLLTLNSPLYSNREHAKSFVSTALYEFGYSLYDARTSPGNAQLLLKVYEELLYFWSHYTQLFEAHQSKRLYEELVTLTEPLVAIALHPQKWRVMPTESALPGELTMHQLVVLGYSLHPQVMESLAGGDFYSGYQEEALLGEASALQEHIRELQTKNSLRLDQKVLYTLHQLSEERTLGLLPPKSRIGFYAHLQRTRHDLKVLLENLLEEKRFSGAIELAHEGVLKYFVRGRDLDIPAFKRKLEKVAASDALYGVSMEKHFELFYGEMALLTQELQPAHSLFHGKLELFLGELKSLRGRSPDSARAFSSLAKRLHSVYGVEDPLPLYQELLSEALAFLAHRRLKEYVTLREQVLELRDELEVLKLIAG